MSEGTKPRGCTCTQPFTRGHEHAPGCELRSEAQAKQEAPQANDPRSTVAQYVVLRALDEAAVRLTEKLKAGHWLDAATLAGQIESTARHIDLLQDDLATLNGDLRT